MLCRVPVLVLVIALMVLACADDPTAEGDGDDDDEALCRGDEVEAPEPEPTPGLPICTTDPGDALGTPCASGDCSVTTDVVLTCDREVSSLGVRVATTDEQAYLVTASRSRAMLLSASGEQATLDPSLLTGFVRQAVLLDQDAAGELYLATDTTDVGMVFRHREAGIWKDLSVEDPDADWISLVHDLESSPAGVVHVWADIGQPWPIDTTYVTDDAQIASGTAYPIDPGSWPHWTLDRQGLPVTLSIADQGERWQLNARRPDPDAVLGVDSVLGSPVVGCSPLAYRPVSPTKPSAPLAPVPDYAVVIQHPDALRIAWPGEAGQPYREFTLADTPLARLECESGEPSEGCRSESECTELADGLDVDGFAVAQTLDGVLWLAWVETHHDRSTRYFEVCEGDECSCASEGIRDDSSARLRVVGFDFATQTTNEALDLAIAPLSAPRGAQPDNARALDMRAWGQQLAIGLRLANGDRPARVRLIQLDASAF
ncbi:hypothetical protein ACNOYE_06995 [Nannocystaceae bacterium ST9]